MRRSIKPVLLVAGFALIIAANSKAQFVELPAHFYDIRYLRYNFNTNGAGARAAGMGHAYTGIADDMTAVTWNPAGLMAQDQVAMQLSFRSTMPNGRSAAQSVPRQTNILADDFAPYFPDNLDIYSTPSSIAHGGSDQGLKSASIVAPIRIKGHPFVGSLSYHTNYDEYQASSASFEATVPIYTTINTGQSVVVRRSVSPAEFTMSSELRGGLSTFAAGFGTRLYGNLTGGLTVNVYTGKTYRTEVFRQHLSRWPDLQVTTIQYADYDAEVRSLDSNSFSGFNVTIGLKYAKDRWTAGIIVRTPYSLDVTLDSIQYLIGRVNGQIDGDAADTIIAPRELTRYQMPLELRAGVGFKATEKLLLAVDVQYQGFSGKKILYRDSLRINPGASNVEKFVETDPLWENVFAFRTGAEYLLKTSFGVIPLRAGFGLVPLPAPSYAIDDSTTTGFKSTGGEVSKNLSLGTGIHWGQIYFDLAYEYTRYDYEQPITFNAFIQERLILSGYSASFTGAPVKSEYKNHQVTFSFTGYF